jgi:hypothetical protein
MNTINISNQMKASPELINQKSPKLFKKICILLDFALERLYGTSENYGFYVFSQIADYKIYIYH